MPSSSRMIIAASSTLVASTTGLTAAATSLVSAATLSTITVSIIAGTGIRGLQESHVFGDNFRYVPSLIRTFRRIATHLDASFNSNQSAFSQIIRIRFGELTPNDDGNEIRFAIALLVGKGAVDSQGKRTNANSGRGITQLGIACEAPDQYQAGVHLCELGHTRIGYIQSNVRIHNFAERQRGFAEALQERGLAVADKHTLSVAPTILSSQEELKQQLQSLIAAGEPLPTAFFCECDYIAISAMKTLGELGWRIPEDISVIGFDNISESRIVSPELTTVHVAKKQIAYHAVDLLMQELEAEDQDKVKIKVDTHFVERSSTAPPKL